MIKKILLVVLALLAFGVTAPAAGAAVSHKATVVNCLQHEDDVQANIWVNVSGSGNVSIRGHGHLHCESKPNEINAKGHFQKFVFPGPGEPDSHGHWIELAATRVYHGLNAHGSIVVPDHHIKWRSGRFRFAFDFWGRSSGSEPGGNHYGSGYFCSDNLDIPQGPPPPSHVRVRIPHTHRCSPPPGSIRGHAKRRDGGLGCQTTDVGFHMIVVEDRDGSNRRWNLEGFGDVQCRPQTSDFAPLSVTVQVCIQQWKRLDGPAGWHDIACTPFNHHVPNPDHHYWKDAECQRGKFRTQLERWGQNYKNHSAHTLSHSSVHHVNSCRLTD